MTNNNYAIIFLANGDCVRFLGRDHEGSQRELVLHCQVAQELDI